MSNDKDRIKLAEAMGYRKSGFPYREWVRDGEHIRYLPDPFISADDDYAVLEWMRKERMDVDLLLAKGCTSGYEIGDYARAYLEAINSE